MLSAPCSPCRTLVRRRSNDRSPANQTTPHTDLLATTPFVRPDLVESGDRVSDNDHNGIASAATYRSRPVETVRTVTPVHRQRCWQRRTWQLSLRSKRFAETLLFSSAVRSSVRPALPKTVLPNLLPTVRRPFETSLVMLDLACPPPRPHRLAGHRLRVVLVKASQRDVRLVPCPAWVIVTERAERVGALSGNWSNLPTCGGRGRFHQTSSALCPPSSGHLPVTVLSSPRRRHRVER